MVSEQSTIRTAATPISPILDHLRLDGKVAVVTGASSGLGAAFAVALASAGANVALGARRTGRLDGVRRQVEAQGRRAISVATDVTLPEDCERLVVTAVTELGSVDILVNNAGIGAAVPTLRESPEHFRSIHDVNLFGAYWMTQSAAARMRNGGSIINVSSVLGFVSLGLPQAGYASSKGALIALTRDLAQQWTARKAIRVNAITPGFFPTEMTEKYDNWDVVMKLIPAGRLGAVEECAALVVFLASDAASYVSGAALAVDGGLLTW